MIDLAIIEQKIQKKKKLFINVNDVINRLDFSKYSKSHNELMDDTDVYKSIVDTVKPELNMNMILDLKPKIKYLKKLLEVQYTGEQDNKISKIINDTQLLYNNYVQAHKLYRQYYALCIQILKMSSKLILMTNRGQMSNTSLKEQILFKHSNLIDKDIENDPELKDLIKSMRESVKYKRENLGGKTKKRRTNASQRIDNNN